MKQSILNVAFVLLLSLPAAAQTSWTNPGTGSWFSSGNWSSGVPSSGTDSTVNGGAAQILSSGAAANNLVVGNTLGIPQAGQMELGSGGALSTYQAFVGNGAGSSGAVTLAGAGTRWDNSYQLFIGYNDAGGSLSVQGGAVVASQFSTIASGSGQLSVATAAVSGAGSQWTNSGTLSVGNQGHGSLTISAGGKVTDTYGTIAGLSSSVGSVTVSGTGSEWANSAGLYLGNSGAATMAVESGGKVSSTFANVATYSGSSASVTVRGDGSEWDTTDSGFVMTVGMFGTASITVSDGGALSAGGGAGSIGIGSGSSLRIGEGARAGTVSASAISESGPGSQPRTVAFDHSDAAYAFSPHIDGSISVSQEGSGTTILAGANTYTGATSVTAGTLVINGSLGNTAVAVGAGATLRGSGSAAGAISLGSGGILSPGGGTDGSLDGTSLAWDGGGRLAFMLGSSSSLLSLSDTFAKGAAGTYRFDFTEGTGFGVGTYSLVDFASSTFSASDFSFAGLDPGVLGSFVQNGNSLAFSVTAVPEPSSCAMIFLGVAAIGWKLRTRKVIRGGS